MLRKTCPIPGPGGTFGLMTEEKSRKEEERTKEEDERGEGVARGGTEEEQEEERVQSLRAPRHSVLVTRVLGAGSLKLFVRTKSSLQGTSRSLHTL